MRKLASLALAFAFVLALVGCAQTSKTWSVSFDLQADKATLSEEDVATLEKLISSDIWLDDLCDCAADVFLDCNDGRSLRYSSDCGTINDISNKRRVELDDNAKKSFNELLQKYGELGFDIQTND